MADVHDDDFLTKKMAEMKRMNEEILRRHLEIEQDKKDADALSNTATKVQRKNSDERKAPGNTIARPPRVKAPPPDPQIIAMTKRDAPPPDPNFNFLSDPSRKRSDSSGDENWRNSEKKGNNSWGQSRRHRSNYGGTDFKNVKSTMEQHKSSFKKNQLGVPHGAMDLTMQMTGKERLQYEAWKKERERVDQARIQRQRTTDGSWRREWDSHKVLDYESDSNENEYERNAGNPKASQHSRSGTRQPNSHESKDTGGWTSNSEMENGFQKNKSSVDNMGGWLERPDLDDGLTKDPRARGVVTGSKILKGHLIVSEDTGKIKITLNNNLRRSNGKEETRTQGNNQKRETGRARGTGRPNPKRFDSSSSKGPSSSWTFLKPELSKPTNMSLPSFSEVPKPLYPGWQSSESERKVSEGCTSGGQDEREALSTTKSLDQQIEDETILCQTLEKLHIVNPDLATESEVSNLDNNSGTPVEVHSVKGAETCEPRKSGLPNSDEDDEWEDVSGEEESDCSSNDGG